MKKIFNIVDRSLGGPGSYCVAGQVPDTLDWNWQWNPNYETFFVNFDVLNPMIQRVSGYGILYESKGLIPDFYNNVEHVLNNFKLLFTPNSHLVEKYPEKCKWCPGGGLWIGGSYGGGEVKLHEKSKMISMVSSTKEMCDLHSFRLKLARFIEEKKNKKIDVTIGSVPSDETSGWRPIYHSLHDYRFSIIMENYIDKWYFTEKIMNCFATGTVPIYVGATDIGKYFNTDGIIFLDHTDSIENLYHKISPLDENDYISRMDAIKENFETVKQYRCIEDYIINNYFKSI